MSKSNVISPRIPVKRINLSINMEETGKNLKQLVQASGYSVKDIMEITGITTEQAIYKWYSGRSIPSLEVQLILSQVLGKNLEEILVIDGDYLFVTQWELLNCRQFCILVPHKLQFSLVFGTVIQIHVY